MASFDLVSDIHLDFWLPTESSEAKRKKKMAEFAKSLLPESPSKMLVIAGDLGHVNSQNEAFLREMREVYENILLVYGNHDHYLETKNIRKAFKNSSERRLADMRQRGEAIEGVRYLDGETAEIEGIRFGGATMWYDFSYGKKALGKTQEQIYQAWWDDFRDRKFISGKAFFTEKMMEEERSKFEAMGCDFDVALTHVGPDWGFLPEEKREDILWSCYFFDGAGMLEKMAGKIWCFGHAHIRCDYEKNGCRLINASLGYPDQGFKKIANIEI